MVGRICGTGSCVPQRTMDNNDMARIVDTSDEWIRERTGVVRRHIIEEETTVSRDRSDPFCHIFFGGHHAMCGL